MINLAGYCTIAIMLSMIITRECRRVGYFLLAVIPTVMLVMIQSRGSLLVLVVLATSCVLWPVALLAALMLIFTPIGELLF